MNVKARSEDSIGRRPDAQPSSSRCFWPWVSRAPRLLIGGCHPAESWAAQRLPASSDLAEQPKARFFPSRLRSEAGAFLGPEEPRLHSYRVSLRGGLSGGRSWGPQDGSWCPGLAKVT